MSEGRKEPLTHAGLTAHKLAIEAHADVIGEQSSEDGPSLKTILALLHYEIASSHCIQQWSAAKLYNFFDFAQPESTDAGPHATGWRWKAYAWATSPCAPRIASSAARLPCSGSTHSS